MSETPVEPTPAQEPANEPDIDWKAKAREWERRAKDNKSAADKLAQIEEAQKTAEQKAAERLAEAERKAAEAEFRASVATIAATSGVPANIAAGPAAQTAEAVEEFTKIVLDWADGRRKQGNYVPNEGRTTTTTGDADMRKVVRQLFDKE